MSCRGARHRHKGDRCEREIVERHGAWRDEPVKHAVGSWNFEEVSPQHLPPTASCLRVSEANGQPQSGRDEPDDEMPFN
jgi:hypothetical protein